MTKTGYTHITLVVDRSGSMAIVRDDAQGAVNQFIADQKATPGEATLTLIEFDAGRSHVDPEWYHVAFAGDIQDAYTYWLHPRGGTALLDAVGRAITETGEFLSHKAEADRPEHVVFVVQTDGQENSSRDWTVETIRALIGEQETLWNWQFAFLGMGPETFAQSRSMGFTNVTRSAAAGASYAGAYANASDAVSGLRTNTVRDLNAVNVTVDEEGKVSPSSS